LHGKPKFIQYWSQDFFWWNSVRIDYHAIASFVLIRLQSLINMLTKHILIIDLN